MRKKKNKEKKNDEKVRSHEEYSNGIWWNKIKILFSNFLVRISFLTSMLFFDFDFDFIVWQSSYFVFLESSCSFRFALLLLLFFGFFWKNFSTFIHFSLGFDLVFDQSFSATYHTWQRPIKMRPMAWKSKPSSQLKTNTNRPNWWPSAFTVSVFPVPAGPRKTHNTSQKIPKIMKKIEKYRKEHRPNVRP